MEGVFSRERVDLLRYNGFYIPDYVLDSRGYQMLVNYLGKSKSAISDPFGLAANFLSEELISDEDYMEATASNSSCEGGSHHVMDELLTGVALDPFKVIKL